MPAWQRGPAPAGMTVGAALDEYLAANGFDVAAYDSPTYEVDMAEVTGDVWTFPNTATRKRAVPFHDLHHVATGYGTDVVGEAEIGAWELVAGCDSLFLWWINLSAVGLGLVLQPRRTVTALRRAVGQRTLYRDPVGHADALTTTVGELRAQLRIPVQGKADHPARLHRRAPGAASDPGLEVPRLVRAALRVVTAGLTLFGGTRTRANRARS